MLPALLAAASPSHADIYAFVDADGTTHFSNVPIDRRYELVLSSTTDGDGAESATEATAIDARLLARAARYEHAIEDAARAAQVDSQLLRAVIAVESAFDERAVSSRGARGLMQLMPVVAQRYGAYDCFDPRQNVRAGARYLRDLIDRYHNDLELVLAAYNAGEDAVERYGGAVPPFKETRAYVPRVLRIYTKLRARDETT
jgi:soluble lytic murein transglycosylase-like protein